MNSIQVRIQPSKMRIKITAVISILGLILGAGIISVLAATVGGFNIDGSVPDAGATKFLDKFGSESELGPVNSNRTKLGVIHSALPPMLEYTNPNAQVDLRNVWLDTNVVGDDVWLYFAWERDSSKGSGVIMYEFQKGKPPVACNYAGTDASLIESCNPWSNRSAGDFIIVWDQQGGKINIIIRTFYNDPDLGLKLNEGVTLDSTVSAAAVSADGYFGEAAINLSDTVFPSTLTSCVTYGTVIPGTLTGNSDTADYKDTVLADFSGQVSVSNCGQIKVIKETDPDDLTGTFPYTIDQDDGGNLTYAGTGTPAKTEITGTLTSDGDYDLHIDLIADTDYQLIEGDVGAEFAMTSIICQVDAETPTINITAGGTFAVKPSTTTTCTITNEQQPGTLIVKKLVVNDDGGTKVATDFTFQVGSDTPITFITDPDQDPSDPLMGKNAVINLITGSYSVTEPAVAGYTTTYNNCTNVTVPAGGSATCTITNDDNPPTLKLVKSVTNDEGGDAVPHEWQLTATGSTLGFTDYGDSTTFHGVKAGVEYTLSESSVTGYAQSGNWSCDAGTFTSPDKITLGLDQDVTCTVTNDDIAPTLKLVKTVTNDDGGNAVPDDWTLYAASSVVGFTDRNFSNLGGSGVFTTIYSNKVYTLSESSLTGYSPGTWTCDKGVTVTDGTISLPEGKTGVTCTINNDDLPPTLKLVKNVTNDNGGTNIAADWTLTASAAAPDDTRNYSHPGNYSYFASVFANTAYTLDETGPTSPSAVYMAGTWSCDKGVTVTDGVITLTEGLTEVTCSITNNDEKAKPTGATTMSWRIFDTLTISGIRAGATGAYVTFRLYSDAACLAQVGDPSTDLTIVDGVAVSSDFTVAAGTYYWKVTYSGDQNNEGFTTRCGYEVTTVGGTVTLPWKE